MGELNSIGGAIHKEEMKGETFFATHPVATAIGSAVASALLVIAAVIIFHI
jgi:hypothetical protein